MFDLPPPSVRPRLKSADITGEALSASTVAMLSKDMLERLEKLESDAAKASDVHQLGARFGEFQKQAEQRDFIILSDLADMRQAQRASSKSTTTWLRYGLSLLAALGAIAPFLSDTLRSNPAAFGPYGAVVAAILIAIGHGAKPAERVKMSASADVSPPPPPTPPSHS
jgi:hypothetical protein